ncbi:hypothetical protein [Nonomuraea wenchangensis]|uniref:hypothetical protein n=1 Tax=Nonomuraea wenchangensis TaxID=568860 RepID=UPI00332A65E3
MAGGRGAVPGRSSSRRTDRMIAGKSDSGGPTRRISPRLCAAIVGQLTCGGTIIETGTKSCRLAQTCAAAVAGKSAG